MIMSENALKNNTNGLPASPSFPVAMPIMEHMIMIPET